MEPSRHQRQVLRGSQPSSRFQPLSGANLVIPFPSLSPINLLTSALPFFSLPSVIFRGRLLPRQPNVDIILHYHILFFPSLFSPPTTPPTQMNSNLSRVSFLKQKSQIFLHFSPAGRQLQREEAATQMLFYMWAKQPCDVSLSTEMALKCSDGSL